MAGAGHTYIPCGDVQVLQTQTNGGCGKADAFGKRRRVQRLPCQCHTIVLCTLLVVSLLSVSLILYVFHARLQLLEAQLAATENRLREMESTVQQLIVETSGEAHDDDEDYHDEYDENSHAWANGRQKRDVALQVTSPPQKFGKPKTNIAVLHLRAFDPLEVTSTTPTESSSYLAYPNQRQVIGDGSQFGRLLEGQRFAYYGKQVMHWQPFSHPVDASKFRLLSDGNVQVLRKGWYAIFAHVTIESSTPFLQVSILHNGVHKLAAASQQVHKDLEHTETITVSTAQYLQINDSLSVSLFYPNMTVSLRGSDTQFNIIKLT